MSLIVRDRICRLPFRDHMRTIVPTFRTVSTQSDQAYVQS